MSKTNKSVTDWLAEEVEDVDANDDFGTVMNQAIDMIGVAIAELPDGEGESHSPRAAAVKAWRRIENGCDPDCYDTDDIETLCQTVGEVELYMTPAYMDCYELFIKATKLMSEAIDKIMRVRIRGEWEEHDGILEDVARGLRNL